VVDSKERAEELKSQIIEDGLRFEQIAQEYSIAEDSIINGMMGAVSRGGMPDELRSVVDAAQVGELIGPVELTGLFYLMRVEKLLPARLDEALQARLQEELFEQWLDAKIQSMHVQLAITPEDANERDSMERATL
jgi:parvulin-like peptidyl-prolyl isomerase